jgi:carbonic anhydrase/acetyltransferase-like protein (isoleucine patch superfamily)
MPVMPYLDHQPRINGDLELANDAFIIGRVALVGPAVLEAQAVIRGDQAAIEIGAHCHLGQRSTIHVDPNSPTRIGKNVWLGDDAVAHGCTLGDTVRVEDRALVLSRSEVGAGSIVEAGALVTEGAIFPDNSYISGSPGRRVRDTTPEERAETARR